MTTCVSALPLHNPLTEQDNSTIVFQITNSTNLNNANVSVKTPLSKDIIEPLELSEGKLRSNISTEDGEGIYSIKIQSNTSNFPKNSRWNVPLSSQNYTFKKLSKNISDSNSTRDGFCNFKMGDYTCEIEDYQAQMMISQALPYHLTKNETFLNRTLKFATEEYGGSQTRLRCQHSVNDFNCETDSNQERHGGIRQGSLINSLWTVYSITENDTVKELAENYTQGSATEGSNRTGECDVWGQVLNKSFDCDTGKAQGSMTLGYWKAFLITGNETYKNIAKNLSKENYTSPRMARGLWLGAELTSNSNYSKRAADITKKWLEKCPDNCTLSQHSETVIAAWMGYRHTSNYGYHIDAVESVGNYSNFTCDPWNNSFQCWSPEQQGLLAEAFWESYRHKQDNSERFLKPLINDSDNGINVSVGLEGQITDPSLVWKARNGSVHRCDIDIYEPVCSLTERETSEQTAYSYYFNSSKTRFPKNGTFKFTTSFSNQTYLQAAGRFVGSQPSYNCPWKTGDTTCDYIVDQGRMIHSFSSYINYNNSENLSQVMKNLTYGNWLDPSLSTVPCDPSRNDYLCNSTSRDEGSYMQGTAISALLENYQETRNLTAYQEAQKFLESYPSDCNVWRGDYNCNSTRGQARLINAYWKGYKITGNADYYDKAKSLAEEATNYTAEPLLGSAFWRSYEYTGNSSYRYRAEEVTSSYDQKCEDGCDPINLTHIGQLFQTAYVFGNQSYIDRYRTLTNAGTTNSSSCGPFQSDFNCNSPRKQGLMGSFYTSAFETVPLELETDLSLSAPSNVDSSETFSIDCSIQNTQNETTLYNTSLNLNSDGLNIESSNNTTADLGYNDSLETAVEAQPETTGTVEVKCTAESITGLSEQATTEINVESSEESSSSGGSGGGGMIDPSQESPYPFQINYTFENIQKRNLSALKNEGVLNESYTYQQDYSCFSAVREVTEGVSTIKIRYSCGETNITMLDRLPSNVSYEDSWNSTLVHYEKKSAEEIKLTYNGSAERKSWKQPLLLTHSFEKPELEINYTIQNLDKENGTLSLSLDVSRETSCTVEGPGGITNLKEIKSEEVKLNLKEGQNTIKLSCGNKTETFTASLDTDNTSETGNNSNRFLIYSLLLFGALSSIGIYFREEIILLLESIVVKYRFRKLTESINQGNTGKAVEEYSKLKSKTDNLAQKIIRSDIELERALYLYLSLDTVLEAEQDNIKLHNRDEILKEAVEFAENNDSETSKVIKEKLAQINQEIKQ